jgi:hypothetical protein
MEILMTQTYEEYLKDVAENGETFSKPKKKKERSEIKIIGSNGNWIYLKPVITLSYGSNEDESIIYIEDNTDNKQLTNDLNTKNFKLHLSGSALYIDFELDYYYKLMNFDDFLQYEYCQNNKQLTIALLNNNKSEIINKWITNVNLL